MLIAIAIAEEIQGQQISLAVISEIVGNVHTESLESLESLFQQIMLIKATVSEFIVYDFTLLSIERLRGGS